MNVPLQQTVAFDQAVLANTLLAGPAAGFLDGAKLALIRVNQTPTYQSVWADVSAEECTFAGYAKKTITWLAVGISDAGVVEALGTTTLMASTDAVTPESAFMLCIVDSAGAVLYAAGSLGLTGIPFARAGDQALFTVRMNAEGTISVEIIS